MACGSYPMVSQIEFYRSSSGNGTRWAGYLSNTEWNSISLSVIWNANPGLTFYKPAVLAFSVVEVGSIGWRRVREVFGPEICCPDGHIDRPKLGSVIFSDAEKRKQLNSIVHPLVRQAMVWAITTCFISGKQNASTSHNAQQQITPVAWFVNVQRGDNPIL